MKKKHVLLLAILAALMCLTLVVSLWITSANKSRDDSRTESKQASSVTTPTRLKLDQIKRGNFSTVEGTWKNSDSEISMIFNGYVSGQDRSGGMIEGNILTDEGDNKSDKAQKENKGPLKMQFKSSVINTDNPYESYIWDMYFIPAGQTFRGEKSSSDRIYLGKKSESGEIYTWSSTEQKRYRSSLAQRNSSGSGPVIDNSPVSPEIADLTMADKNALALLGVPKGFGVGLGFISGNDMLNGYFDPEKPVTDQNKQPVKNVSFTGVVLIPGPLKNQQSVNIVGYPTGLNAVGNRFLDSFTIIGDSVTYTIVDQGSFSGTWKDQILVNLVDLYNQYKDTDKIERMKERIVQSDSE